MSTTIKLLLVVLVLMGILWGLIFSMIEEYGGVKAIVTEFGKDVKDVVREVDNH